MYSLFDLEDLSVEELQKLTRKSLSGTIEEQRAIVALDLLEQGHLKDSPLSVPEYKEEFLRWYKVPREYIESNFREDNFHTLPENVSGTYIRRMSTCRHAQRMYQN